MTSCIASIDAAATALKELEKALNLSDVFHVDEQTGAAKAAWSQGADTFKTNISALESLINKGSVGASKPSKADMQQAENACQQVISNSIFCLMKSSERIWCFLITKTFCKSDLRILKRISFSQNKEFSISD